MRSSGVPFVQRWIVWTGNSMRPAVTKPLNFWYLLVTALFIVGYGAGVGVVGLGWLITLPIVHLSVVSVDARAGSSRSSWLSPFLFALLWLPRWRTGVIAEVDTVMVVSLPVVAITVARRILLVRRELLGKARTKQKVEVGGKVVKLKHNPISEAHWVGQRVARTET